MPDKSNAEFDQLIRDYLSGDDDPAKTFIDRYWAPTMKIAIRRLGGLPAGPQLALENSGRDCPGTGVYGKHGWGATPPRDRKTIRSALLGQVFKYQADRPERILLENPDRWRQRATGTSSLEIRVDLEEAQERLDAVLPRFGAPATAAHAM